MRLVGEYQGCLNLLAAVERQRRVDAVRARIPATQGPCPKPRRARSVAVAVKGTPA